MEKTALGIQQTLETFTGSVQNTRIGSHRSNGFFEKGSTFSVKSKPLPYPPDTTS